MTAAGWIFMVASWLGITLLTVYSFYRILRKK